MLTDSMHRWRHQLLMHIDLPLLWITLGIMTFGLMTVFSATYIGGHGSKAMGQLINMMVALLIMWGCGEDSAA